ncbi:unnamed protein product [Owenia fusiformis]|uniref:Uncharacterized protein n=1 Tax=Owenia fusiformis TaxID=6347 RepID=A0A8J1TT92_OWEFU|nr:unnamed protein product [Owenia fusiformis]
MMGVVKICPDENDLNQPTRRDFVCGIDGCQRLMSHVPAWLMHKVHVHKMIENDTERALMTKTPKVKEKLEQQFYCPKKECYYGAEAGVRHFPTFNALRQHYKRKHAEKQFKCNQCPSAFGREWDLKHHMKTCNPGAVFKCTCQKFYGSVNSLKRHCLDQKHKPETPDHFEDPPASRKKRAVKEEKKPQITVIYLNATPMPTSQVPTTSTASSTPMTNMPLKQTCLPMQVSLPTTGIQAFTAVSLHASTAVLPQNSSLLPMSTALSPQTSTVVSLSSVVSPQTFKAVTQQISKNVSPQTFTAVAQQTCTSVSPQASTAVSLQLSAATSAAISPKAHVTVSPQTSTAVSHQTSTAVSQQTFTVVSHQRSTAVSSQTSATEPIQLCATVSPKTSTSMSSHTSSVVSSQRSSAVSPKTFTCTAVSPQTAASAQIAMSPQTFAAVSQLTPNSTPQKTTQSPAVKSLKSLRTILPSPYTKAVPVNKKPPRLILPSPMSSYVKKTLNTFIKASQSKAESRMKSSPTLSEIPSNVSDRPTTVEMALKQSRKKLHSEVGIQVNSKPSPVKRKSVSDFETQTMGDHILKKAMLSANIEIQTDTFFKAPTKSPRRSMRKKLQSSQTQTSVSPKRPYKKTRKLKTDSGTTMSTSVSQTPSRLYDPTLSQVTNSTTSEENNFEAHIGISQTTSIETQTLTPTVQELSMGTQGAITPTMHQVTPSMQEGSTIETQTMVLLEELDASLVESISTQTRDSYLKNTQDGSAVQSMETQTGTINLKDLEGDDSNSLGLFMNLLPSPPAYSSAVTNSRPSPPRYSAAQNLETVSDAPSVNIGFRTIRTLLKSNSSTVEKSDTSVDTSMKSPIITMTTSSSTSTISSALPPQRNSQDPVLNFDSSLYGQKTTETSMSASTQSQLQTLNFDPTSNTRLNLDSVKKDRGVKTPTITNLTDINFDLATQTPDIDFDLLTGASHDSLLSDLASSGTQTTGDDGSLTALLERVHTHTMETQTMEDISSQFLSNMETQTADDILAELGLSNSETQTFIDNSTTNFMSNGTTQTSQIQTVTLPEIPQNSTETQTRLHSVGGNSTNENIESTDIETQTLFPVLDFSQLSDSHTQTMLADMNSLLDELESEGNKSKLS